jgi:hypothetical protein
MPWCRSLRLEWLIPVLLLAAVPAAAAQTPVSCEPLAQRAGRQFGCFITAHLSLGALPSDTALFWLIDTFPSVAAATAVRPTRGVVVQSFGSTWLFTIGPRNWVATSGHRVAAVGPLPLVPADSFALVALESTLAPGMVTPVHRHPGAEAFLTMAGEMCVETPTGVVRQRAGNPGLVLAGGTAMVLTSTGSATRRSLAVVLHDAAQPRSALAPDWTPRGLCAPLQ